MDRLGSKERPAPKPGLYLKIATLSKEREGANATERDCGTCLF